MKAVTFSTFGGPEVLQITEKPDPQPQAGEVLVAVAAATINPTDLMSISGAHAQAMKDLTPPYTAGMDFSGYVVSAGAGVTGLSEGQPVIGVVSPRRPRGGAQAELICVPAASLAPLRQGVDLIAAATVPMNALTAMLSLELLSLKRGDRLLVTGAAGMLGTLAVQLARLVGLRVLANAAASDGAFLTNLGVEAILPRDEGLEIALRAACPDGVDGVIDGALIGQKIAHLVRDGGGIVSPRSSYRIEDPRLKVSYVQVTSGIEDREKIARIGQLLDQGKLATRVAPNGVFPFTQAADAYRMAETARLRGRVVMTFSG
jgi:NADPH:quinone reductase-like Zn-dependent oxidoreductase